MTDVVLTLANRYPWIAVLLIIVGGLRVVLKPMFAAWVSWSAKNLTAEQLAKVHQVEGSLWFKVMAFLIDYLGSIKLGAFQQQTNKESNKLNESNS